jgi:hypothetical protein
VLKEGCVKFEGTSRYPSGKIQKVVENAGQDLGETSVLETRT